MTDHLCLIQEETVHLYLDGELKPPEREAFIVHLRQCERCQIRLAEIQTLFTKLSSLEEISPPGELVSQVMANLPASATASGQVMIGRLALIGQIIMGLVSISIAWPMIFSDQNSQVAWQSWLTLSDIGLSLTRWLIDLTLSMSQQVLSQWPPKVEFSGFNISSDLATVLIAGLGLAWLIGNGVLLRYNQSSVKNGGTS